MSRPIAGRGQSIGHKRHVKKPLILSRRSSGELVSRIVLRVLVFEAQRTNGRYLSDVLAGLCPVEVPRIAGQNDDAAGWICLDLIAVELFAEADVEDAGHDRVDPVLGCLCGMSFTPDGALTLIT